MASDDLKLRHFTRDEFDHLTNVNGQVIKIDWWPKLSKDLLLRVDLFRHILGVPVIVSPAADAVGRYRGPGDDSRHNIDMWGEVQAVDLMPQMGDMFKAYTVAVMSGFTGIGIYPDWTPHWGIHVDVRPGQNSGMPATWCGLNVKKNGKVTQEYFGITEAFVKRARA